MLLYGRIMYVFLIFVTCPVIFTPLFASADPGFNAAMKAYNDHRYSEAERRFKELDKKGKICIEVSRTIAHMYQELLFGFADPEEANRLLGRAAKNGDQDCQLTLGSVYAHFARAGAKEFYPQAVKWYERAAAQGNTQASLKLGYMYSKNTTLLNFEEAVKWFAHSANLGNGEAQKELGDLYAKGIEISPDYKEAFYWYSMAAANNETRAVFIAADMYYNGKGTSKDYIEAARLYTKASDMGIDEAMYRLANMYMEGQGVEKDYIQAYKWMQLAFGFGNRKAIGTRDWLGFQMKDDDIMKAKQSAAEWRPDPVNNVFFPGHRKSR